MTGDCSSPELSASVSCALGTASEGGGVAGCAPGGCAPAPPALPCPKSEQLNIVLTSFRGQRTTARDLVLNVCGLAMRYGVERLGSLLLTFRDDVTIAEASRRFNSLNNDVLRGRYEAWVVKVERGTTGKRVHLHGCMVTPVDIQTGYNAQAVARRDYRSVCPWLRQEWQFLNDVSERYGFGIWHPFKPIESLGRFAGYLAKYMAKGMTKRDPRDRQFRLVRYSRNFPRVVGGPYSWLSGWYSERRERFGLLADALGLSERSLQFELGRRWPYVLRQLLDEETCSRDAFWHVVTSTKAGLEIHGGLRFILEEEIAAELSPRRSRGGML